MKSSSPIRTWVSTAAVSGLILSMGVFAFRANADVWNKKTVITIDQPMQVENTYLEPGSYVFKLLDSPSDRHVVEIFNGNESRLINTILAIPNYRLQPTGGSRFMFYETPPGSVNAVRAWFYPGDNFGQEFRYPKQVKQLALAVSTTPTLLSSPTEPRSQAVVSRPTESEAAASPAPQTVNESAVQGINEPVTHEEAVIVAQNNTPPPPPQPEVSQSQRSRPAQPPTELPKTATLFPLMGVCGLVSLALYSLIRIANMT